MTLANLLTIKRLLAFSVRPEGVQRLLVAAVRNVADAPLLQRSAENRFDAAYKCIIQCTMLGLSARNYSTSISQPGRDQHAIVAVIETEQVLVSTDRESLRRFKAKIKNTIDRVWSAA